MKDIMLINIDSTIVNIALMKIEMYHIGIGDNVYWDMPIFANKMDKIYVSVIFSANKNLAKEYTMYDAEIGGTGWDIGKKLPPEIDAMKPKINIGFATRGCIRKCSFCVVPEKEGYIYADQDTYDIWDGKSRNITLLDNNILALPEHFALIASQIRKENIRVDFNQGLDHRLLTDDMCKMLGEIKHKQYKFAFDHPSYIDGVSKAIDMLDKHKIMRNMWYVLCGYNTTFDEDMERVLYIKSREQDPYVMRYETLNGNKLYNDFAAWVNQPSFFKKMSFDEFRNVRHKNRREVK